MAEKKKSNRGRKPIPDKKLQVSIWVRKSIIEDTFGGMGNLQTFLLNSVNEYERSG